jgi:hypothetical protein
MTAPTATDAVQRATAVVEQLAAGGVASRLIGGLGIAVHRHASSPPSLDRSYGDVDVVVAAGASSAVTAALAGSHIANRRFNALHGDRRMLFHRADDGEQLDVFVGRFSMCHSLDLSSRLVTVTAGLSPADLFLTKAQIVEINDKDLLDIVSLMHHHAAEKVDDPTADIIDLGRLSQVCAADWGWYTTVTDNLAKVAERATDLLPPADAGKVGARCHQVADHLVAAPKSLRWRARAKVGRRVPWYELPEEIAHG